MATPKKGSRGSRAPQDVPHTLAEGIPATEIQNGTETRETFAESATRVADNTGDIATRLNDGVAQLATSANLLNTSATNLVDATYRVAERLTAVGQRPGIASTDRTVTLTRADPEDSQMEPLWWAINLHTDAISFASYDEFLSRVLGGGIAGPGEGIDPRTDLDLRTQVQRLQRLANLPGVDIYDLLRTATETFLLLQGGVRPTPTANVGALSTAELRMGAGTFSIPASAGVSGPFGRDVLPPEVDRVRRPGSTTITVEKAQNQLALFLGNARNNYLTTVIQGAFPTGEVTVASPFSMANDIQVGNPCLMELIWSYWMEEGMLTQTLSAITRRFQNVRRAGRGPDPLAEFELDPLRPLNGFIWGYLQDEPNRLSLVRRAYEYNHHYGLTLYGRAVPPLRPADPRSRFLESFHNLLRQAADFYKEDNDTTVIADAFPVLNSLKETHLVLSEGAHNQFRDLPWTARVDMLMQQWLLARPEMREFLRGRYMVAYPERWMGAVDSMKRLQGWTETSVIHFRDLARFGERILLSIRYGNWSATSDQNDAKAWLRYWKEEIQGYIHAYHAATGVNLSDDVVEVRNRADVRYLQPSFHLRNRLLAEQRSRRMIR